jgi:hypothetical protein
MNIVNSLVLYGTGSVADPKCSSLILDPDFFQPGSKNNKKEEGRKFALPYLFWSHKFHKIEYYSFLNRYNKI